MLLRIPCKVKMCILPRYINLSLELIQFLDRDIPCNFSKRITASLTVFGVKQLVQETFSFSLLDLKVGTRDTQTYTSHAHVIHAQQPIDYRLDSI